ncbi:hypothetical protein GQ457_16G013140 [Hibiscus cannabinus]
MYDVPTMMLIPAAVMGRQCFSVLLSLFLLNESNPLKFSSSNVERLKSDLKEYVLKHGHSLNNKCNSCFCSSCRYYRKQLKINSGAACSMESQKGPVLIVEAVITIRELAESPCFGSHPLVASLDALTTVDWRSYGLTFGSIVDQLILISRYIYSLTCVIKFIIYPGKYRHQPDRHPIKKAMKLALDYFKGIYTGFLLTAHNVKVSIHLFSSCNSFEADAPRISNYGSHKRSIGKPSKIASRER